MNEIDEELDEIIEPDDISIGSDNSELDKLYDDFNERYPIEKLKSLTIEEYTNLKEISEDYFCTWVERRAQKLGSIQGATSLKFGIYKINELPKIQCVVDDVNKANFVIVNTCASTLFLKIDSIYSHGFSILTNALNPCCSHMVWYDNSVSFSFKRCFGFFLIA